MKLSIVTTLYKSSPFIHEFVERSINVAQDIVGDSFEIVLVNDGSPDDSLDVALQLASSTPNLVIVDLSRNFGHHHAMMAGLQHASGEKIFLIDVDLEESPEWLRAFTEKMTHERCDVVYGVQSQRKGGWFERVSGSIYWRYIHLFNGLQFPRNMTTARLMTRRYVDAISSYGERELNIGGLWYLAGFEQVAVKVSKGSRPGSTYSLRRKLRLLVNSVVSFSNRPLYWVFGFGALMMAGSSIFIIRLVLQWAFLSRPPAGYTSLMLSIWFLGGVTIMSMGVIGIYVGKIFTEVKQRPSFIVRTVHRSKVR
jgi:putative glycosyltransferase